MNTGKLQNIYSDMEFIFIESMNLFSRLKLNDSFLYKCSSSWETNAIFLEAKNAVYLNKAVNDTAEKAVKLTQDFQTLITVEEEQKQYLLRCVRERWKMYPDCKIDTLKRKYPL